MLEKEKQTDCFQRRKLKNIKLLPFRKDFSKSKCSGKSVWEDVLNHVHLQSHWNNREKHVLWRRHNNRHFANMHGWRESVVEITSTQHGIHVLSRVSPKVFWSPKQDALRSQFALKINVIILRWSRNRIPFFMVHDQMSRKCSFCVKSLEKSMESPIDNECVECDDYEVAGLIAICKVLTKTLNPFDETENESCSVCVFTKVNYRSCPLILGIILCTEW